MPLGNIDLHGRTAIRIYPDPDRMIEHVEPPITVNRPKDDSEIMEIDTHVDNNTIFYFDKQITLDKGDLNSHTPSLAVTNFPGALYYSDTDKSFKNGIKMYNTGPFVAGEPWTPYIENKTTKELQIVAQLYVAQNVDGRLVSTAPVALTVILAHDQISLVPFSTNWSLFQDKAEEPSTVGWFMTFKAALTSGNDSSIVHSKSRFGIVWPALVADRSNFDGAYTWVRKSLWDLKGPASSSLQSEWNGASQVSVTGFDFNVKNVTTQLNLNGDINAGIIMRGTEFEPSPDPLLLYNQISSLPQTAYRLGSPLAAKTGVHCTFPIDDVTAEFRSADAFRALGASKYDLPYGVIAIVCDGPITPESKPSLTIHGRIHLEWRTESILPMLRTPSANIGLFTQVLNQLKMAGECGYIWTENPSHLKKIRDFAVNIVTSKPFKTVLRDVALVGLESVASLLLV